MREGGNSNVSLRGGGIIHDFLAWGIFLCADQLEKDRHLNPLLLCRHH